VSHAPPPKKKERERKNTEFGQERGTAFSFQHPELTGRATQQGDW